MREASVKVSKEKRLNAQSKSHTSSRAVPEPGREITVAAKILYALKENLDFVHLNKVQPILETDIPRSTILMIN